MRDGMCRGLLTVALALMSIPAAAQSRADAGLNALLQQAARSEALLRLVMQQLPKGADLHRHSEGAIYAEDFIDWAAAREGCLIVETRTLARGPCTPPVSVPLQDLDTRDTKLYNDAIDAMSMGRHDPDVRDEGVSGHERFFASFRRFNFGTAGERARTIAVNREQAAYDNIHYLELMSGVDLGRDLRPVFAAEPWNEADMAGRFERLKPLTAELMPLARASIDATERQVAELNGCSTGRPTPACAVTLRYLMTIGRESPPEQVFGRMVMAFAVVNADQRYVGVNIAQPEDGPISLRDYSLHMRMFAFLKTQYPKVQLTLHAGELTIGLAPPRDLRFHIREAVEIAGARRIGHGVDIVYEEGAVALLQRMARERIAVEINLTSNDVILGVKGSEHPLPVYLAAGVPVAFSSDDPGVSRADLTHDYLRAVTEHGLSYTQLRQISRDGLTYSFLEGASLWEDGIARRVKPCAGSLDRPGAACEQFLAGSAKAREQWRLEQSFARFEAGLPGLVKALSR
ncbi:MAG: adenosine deaminase [Steroidobacteraceae bacterium]